MSALAFIEKQEPNIQKTMLYLRSIILDSGIHIEETFSYKVAFYKYLGWLCYINYSKGKLYIGFCEGHLLSDEYGLLAREERKQIYRMYFTTITDVQQKEEALRATLQEALLVNEEKQKLRKIKKAKTHA